MCAEIPYDEGVNIERLESLVAIAECGSVRAAARERYLAPSTLAGHLRDLEAEVGARLVEREGRQVRLTAAGARLAADAREIVARAAQAVAAARAAGRGEERRLVVAASPLLAGTSVPRLLRRLLEALPDTELVVRVERSGELGGLVARGEADAAFSRLAAPAGLDDLVFEREPVLLVAGDPGRESEAAPLALDDVLPALPLLVDTHPGYGPALLAALERRGLVGRTLPVTDTAAAKRLVEEGLGVSFLPLSAVRHELFEGRLVEVLCGALPLPVAESHLLMPAAPGLCGRTLALTVRRAYGLAGA
jgi:LysR family transcriptional repressor of citA